MNKKAIAVVIVSFNARRYLADCFSSTGRQGERPEEIIVVDNNSSDGTSDYLRGLSSINGIKIRTILNKKNQGFAKGNNQGIQQAMADKMDYIFLLNQDTEIDPGCLRHLLGAAEKQKDGFIWQPMILCHSQKNLIQTSGDRIHFLGFGCSGDYGLEIKNLKLEIKEIPYASGAAMLLKSESLKEIGLFDEDLFMYHEDMDLCLKGRLLGKKIFLVPQAIVYHKYQAKITPFKWAWSERNRQLTLLKFYKFPTLLFIFPCWLMIEIGSLFYSALIGALFLKIKGYFEIFSLLPKFLKKRKKIQKTRKIKDKELARYLDEEFHFSAFSSPLFYFLNPILGSSWRVIRKIMWW